MAKRKRDPKKGTGKKPKGSKRRLYTDENPKDTVRIKFATVKDARATVRKVKRVRKSYARKIQILTVGEQRARVMGKKTVASVFKSGKAKYIKNKEGEDIKERINEEIEDYNFKNRGFKGISIANLVFIGILIIAFGIYNKLKSDIDGKTYIGSLIFLSIPGISRLAWSITS